MTPGPTLIKQCTSCSKPIKQPTINSGNTFGATFWSDAKREAPMMPEQPWLILCPHCKAPLWIDELEEVGKVNSYGVKDEDFTDAEKYTKPTIEDFLSVLDGELSADKKRYLRLSVWWAGNDSRREPKKSSPLSQREILNLNEFAKMMFEANENDRLMKAEVLRELGRFDEALNLLINIKNFELAKVADQIKTFALEKDSLVRKLNFD